MFTVFCYKPDLIGSSLKLFWQTLLNVLLFNCLSFLFWVRFSPPWLRCVYFDIFVLFLWFFFFFARFRLALNFHSRRLRSPPAVSPVSVPAGDTEWLPGQELPSSPWDLVRKPLSQCITIRLKGTNLATLPLHSLWFPRQTKQYKKKSLNYWLITNTIWWMKEPNKSAWTCL